MDLIIAGAIINDHRMIENAIASLPEYEFNSKYILFDGFTKEGKGGLFYDDYQGYKKYIELKYPEFIVIEFDENIYFREMINHICRISNAERLFILQDDVCCNQMDLKQIEIQMNHLDDCKILSFPHKYIGPLGTHWYEPFDDSYPLPFIKTHGFSERVFICDRKNVIKICNESEKNNKNNKRFIEFIYHTAMKSRKWKTSTYDEKAHYWKKFGCYIHHDIYHRHQVGTRPQVAKV